MTFSLTFTSKEIESIFIDFLDLKCKRKLKVFKEGVHLSIWEILAKIFGGKACGAI